MGVPLLDLAGQYRNLRGDLDAAIRRVVESQRFILGEEVEALEREIAALAGVPHAIGVASGTDALLLALRVAGVGPGDDVIVPSFTFFATAGAVVNAGARPVFADVEPDGFNLDASTVEAALTPATRAVIPVHLFGQCAGMEEISALAARRDLVVIEDAAQAIGARLGDRQAGSMGRLGCYSFFPTKNLGGFGDGGMITTVEDGLALRLRRLRVHGQSGRYVHDEVGYNSRLDALQAAVLRAKLPYLGSWTEARRRNAAYYRERFAALGLSGEALVPPVELPGRRHVYNQFVIRAQGRDALKEHLGARGIGTAIYYPKPLHRQECFEGKSAGAEDLGVCERAAGEVLALPIYPELVESQLEEVVEAVASHYGAGA